MRTGGEPGMVSVGEAKRKAARRYEKDYRIWAASLFSELIGQDHSCEVVYAISLHPPTEKQVLGSYEIAHNWANLWRSSSLKNMVEWSTKNWSRVGSQTIPVRLILKTPENIARCAGLVAHWKLIVERVGQLADRWNKRWTLVYSQVNYSALLAAIRSTIGRCRELDEANWQMLLLVLDWLADNQNRTCYIRQLPIRGIDTKWIESHEGIVKPLYKAMSSCDPQFARPSKQFRMRVLDKNLSFGGLTDFAVSAEQLNGYPSCPEIVLVCENLVNVLSLPPMLGVMAIHGGGYAVGELGAVSWLSSVPILYWGDLDSNGFAILNQLRSHFPHVVSTMMDDTTLERYGDLCGDEPKPTKAFLSHLTHFEQETLAQLLLGDQGRGIGALRLEQERIEWEWACGQIEEALKMLRA